jgi:hypothetical protein
MVLWEVEMMEEVHIPLVLRTSESSISRHIELDEQLFITIRSLELDVLAITQMIRASCEGAYIGRRNVSRNAVCGA